MLKAILNWWMKYAYIVMLLIMVAGLFYPVVMLVFIICMLAPLATGYFTGRYWCGNLCPIGNFFDNVLIGISNKKRAPELFKSRYVRIIFTAFMMAMVIFEVMLAIRKPSMMGMMFYEMILEATIIGTFLSVIYHHRVWCHFCPMGSTGSIMTYISKRKKVLKISSHCSTCKKCEDSCPMGLAPYEYKGGKLTSHHCIQCGICSQTCPSKRIGYDIIDRM